MYTLYPDHPTSYVEVHCGKCLNMSTLFLYKGDVVRRSGDVVVITNNYKPKYRRGLYCGVCGNKDVTKRKK